MADRTDYEGYAKQRPPNGRWSRGREMVAGVPGVHGEPTDVYVVDDMKLSCNSLSCWFGCCGSPNKPSLC